MRKKNVLGHIAGADIRMLRIFKTVVNCGGFAAAESELNISRAAISIAMSDLEQRLALTLCSRGRGGFSLTEEGEQVYQAVLQLLDSHQYFQQQINFIHSELKGDLSIGITDCLVTLPQMLISDSLRTLKLEAPEINISIEMLPAEAVIKSLLKNRIQTGVAPVYKKNSRLNYVHLYDEESLLYCGRKHPLFHLHEQELQPEEIVKHELVAPSLQQENSTCKVLDNFEISAQASDREGIAFLILTGCYIGFLPEHMAQQWVSKGQLKALLPEHFRITTPYAAITRKDIVPNLILSHFQDHLESQIDNEISEGKALN